MRKVTIILLGFLLLLHSSCSSELNQYSHSAIPPESVNYKDLPALRIGLYHHMQNDPTTVGFIMFDLLGGCIQGRTGSPINTINGLLSPLNSNVVSQWNGYYHALYQMNNVLGIINGFPETVLTRQTKGEALYFRAYIYFNLAARWGDVPLLKTNTMDKPARSPLSEVWSFIEEDLELAQELLPNNAKNEYYICKDAATALLARVSLSQGKMEKAKEYAESLIKSGRYHLDSFEKIFRKQANGEVIFAFENKNEESGINISDLFYTYAHPNKGQGRYQPSPAFIKLFSDEDKRLDITFVDVAGSTCINKYPSGQTGRDPFIVARIAEMYLISAEAQGPAGISRLNELRAARGLSPLATSSKEEYIDLLLDERRREFVGENMLYHDLVRTNRAIKDLGILPHQTLLPIPGKELQLNDNLTPNPGY